MQANMTTGHIFIATSLDGLIARSDGSIDWLERPGLETEDHGFEEMMASVDGLIMGRGTYEKVLEFGEWPYEKPVIVLTRSLKAADIPKHLQNKLRFSVLPPKELMDELAAMGWKRAYVDGGKLIQSFLAAGLIEDMVITRIPVLIGTGRALFGAVPKDVELEHIETQSFKSGLVSSRYRVLKPG
jgi:dihydrofolate reductase